MVQIWGMQQKVNVRSRVDDAGCRYLKYEICNAFLLCHRA